MGALTRKLSVVAGRVLRVQPGEGRRVALMFGLMMCVVGMFIIGRVARDTLFLSRFPSSWLPSMYLWVALGVFVQAGLYSRITDRFRRDRILQASLASAASLMLVSRVLVGAGLDWFLPVLYVLVELAGNLLILQSWTLANDIFTTREAKRLFGVVGAGGVVSSVLVGFGSRAAVSRLGTPELLLLCALLLVTALLLLHRLGRHYGAELNTHLVERRLHPLHRLSLIADGRRVFGNRHLQLVSVLILLITLVTTFCDFQFKASAQQAFAGQEKNMGAFFGMFWGVTGILSCVIQLLITGRLLERFGVLLPLLLLPGSLTLGAISFLVQPALWSASLLKGSDAVLRYTVNDATMQFLYLPVSAGLRGRAKALLDGMVRPFAIGVSGALLVWIVPRLPLAALTWITLALLGGWILAAVGVRHRYLSALMQTVMSRRFSLEEAGTIVPDDAASRVLRQALTHPSRDIVLHALEMIRGLPAIDWTADLLRLAEHPSPEVRARTVEILGERGQLRDGVRIARFLKDESRQVQAAAVTAFCAVGRERAVRVAAQYLRHPDLHIQAAAVSGLVRFAGLDGVLSAAEKLKALLESPDPAARAAGARILGEVGVRNFYHPLLQLLSDPEETVRLAAVRAAGRMRSPELLPTLVYRLEEPQMHGAVSDALVAYGEPAVRLLQRVLAQPAESVSLRAAVPPILARIGGRAALDVLAQNIEEPNPLLRSRVLEAIHAIRLRDPRLVLDPSRLKDGLDRELAEMREADRLLAELNLPATERLLRECLVLRRERALRRIFRLLSGFLPPRSLDAVLRNLNAPQRQIRANALEILDNLLDKSIRRRLLPVLEPPSGGNGQHPAEEPTVDATRRRQVLEELMQSSDAWVTCCALEYASRVADDPQTVTAIEMCTVSDDPLVRETALLSLARLLPPERRQVVLQRHVKDPSSRVRSFAESMLAGAPTS